MHLRLATQSFKQHFDAQQQRETLRWAWHDFLQKYDVMLTPVTTTAAFKHDHSEPATHRILTVNGQPTDYFAQLFWAGLAVCPLLPATSAPAGFTPEGLPVGLQIIGPEMGGFKTIWVAGQLERLLFHANPGDNTMANTKPLKPINIAKRYKHITPVPRMPNFAAWIEGVDLTKPLSAQVQTELRQALFDFERGEIFF